MISKKMAEALSDQVTKETLSAYLYQAMASQAYYLGYKGVANWFQIQVQEEINHAKKLYQYIQEQGAKVILGAIPKPVGSYKDPIDLFEKTLAHEKKVTGMINNLVRLAKQENDAATGKMLEWFVKEQVEEEEGAGKQLTKAKAAGSDKNKLAEFDKDLAGRK
ncbi:MAG: ferritin [Candidatus Margulisbacteria bacterium]|nr:ferritin [Candidatus Margulisiibacteriota bacterium]